LPRKLRDYQQRDLQAKVVLNLERDLRIFLAYCVAAGKTVMALLTARILHDRGFITHVVFIAPSKPVRDQFVRGANRTYETYDDWQGGSITTPDVVALVSTRITGSERLVSYLQNSDGFIDGRWACAAVTYNVWRDAAFNIKRYLEQGDRAKRVLVVADEAQHIYLYDKNDPTINHDEINQITKAVMSLPVRLMRLSGTPSRPDPHEVRRDDDPNEVPVVRPLVESMLEGYTPKELLSQVVTVQGMAENVGDEENGSVYVPIDYDAGAVAMALHWDAAGRPPLVIRIKCSTGESNQRALGIVKEAFALRHPGLKSFPSGGAGVEMIDATGDDPIELEDYLLLEDGSEGRPRLTMAEMDRHNARVIASFRRFDEGTDCPSRAMLYLFGCPRSMELFQQLIGRILRLRIDYDTHVPLIEDYPPEWLDRSKVVLFVAGIAGGINEADTEHTMTLLNLVGYLSNFTEIGLLRGLLRLPDGFSSRKNNEGPYGGISIILSPEERQAASKAIDDVECILNETKSTLDRPWLGDQFYKMVQTYITEENLNVREEALQHELALRRLRKDKSGKSATKVKLAWERLLGEGMNLTEAFLAALRELFTDFREATMVNNTTHQLDGQNIELYSARLKLLQRGHRPKSIEDIVLQVRKAQERAELLPAPSNRKPFPAYSAVVPDYPTQTFRGLDDILTRGRVEKERDIPRVEGGLYQLVVLKMFESGRKPWYGILQAALEEIESKSRKTAEHPSNALFSGPADRSLRKFYTFLPEVVYLPDAWRVCRMTFAPQLSPREAQLAGKALGATLPPETLEGFVARHGIDVLRRHLEAETLRDALQVSA
jgi:hypothetical protein